MNFIRKAEQQMFVDFIQVENVPEIMHSYIIPHARRTVYGDAHVKQHTGVITAEEFCHKFGISMHAFIQLWRMEKAAAPLSSPDADMLLTDDFVREFTRYYNCSPDHFRKL